MTDIECDPTLQLILSKLDSLAISADRREDMLLKINGHVREHGEQLAAHQEWIKGHTNTHNTLDNNMQTLSNRVWALSGGSGILAVVATILQIFNL